MTGNSTYGTNVAALSITSCILSMIGGLVILVTYGILPEIRNFTRKLIICLTVADILSASGYIVSSTSYLINENNHEWYICHIQSTITTFSSIASFFFTSVIAVYIFDTVTHERDRMGTYKWLLTFNVLSWGVPGKIICILPTFITPTAIYSVCQVIRKVRHHGHPLR